MKVETPEIEVTPVVVSPEAVQKAEAVKEKANDYFKKKQFSLALEHYSTAIELNPHVAVYYANRSFSHLKLENYGSALQDATTAIDVDADYVKAYYRRATAYMALGKFKLALKDYDEVRHKKPNDKDARDKYTECNKIVKRVAFERAIAVDEKNTSVVDSIDLSSMSIEDEYAGPKLEDGKVTVEFINQLIETYNKQKKLHSKYAYQILLCVREYFSSQPTLVDVPIPDGTKFTVCGDIHGQYYDLINVFNLNGRPNVDNPYLFNGDFVDRGSFSVECIFILFSYKLLYPQHFFMSRGNHESAMMNQMYGFEGEVKSKYSSQMADLFTEVYNLLPLAHCLNKKILVMHGGLFSKDDVTLDDIRNLNRNRQPPDEGLMCELLWSDPISSPGRSPSKRGVGIQFGPDVTHNFIANNNLDYIIRSHEVKADGYEVTHNNKCITIFSAPNYCDTMGNKGAFITLKAPDLSPSFTSYDAVPHPNIKPMAYANSLLSLFA